MKFDSWFLVWYFVWFYDFRYQISFNFISLVSHFIIFSILGFRRLAFLLTPLGYLMLIIKFIFCAAMDIAIHLTETIMFRNVHLRYLLTQLEWSKLGNIFIHPVPMDRCIFMMRMEIWNLFKIWKIDQLRFQKWL